MRISDWSSDVCSSDLSGTTGNPKGVIITIGNMLFAAEGLLKSMPPKGQERFFSYLPLAHAFERGAVELASIYFGAEVFFLENLEKLAEQLPEVAPTRFYGEIGRASCRERVCQYV